MPNISLADYIATNVSAVVLSGIPVLDDLMLWNPYPFVVVVIAAGVGVLAGVFIYIWKHRTLKLDFPAPPGMSKAVFWFWLAPIVVGILQVGPDMLLAMLMYLAIIYTLLASYFYFRKARYVFTN